MTLPSSQAASTSVVQQQQTTLTTAETRQMTQSFSPQEASTSEMIVSDGGHLNGVPQPIKEETVSQNGDQPDNSVATWLNVLGLGAYIDGFHEQNLYSLLQLDDFSLEDLAKMKIGNAHRNKIWKSLLDLRNQGFTAVPVDSQELQKSASSTSTISIASQNSISQNSTYNPGYYEVTRYTFKHTISIAEEQNLKEPSAKVTKMDES